MSDRPHTPTASRRAVLGGLAGVGLLSVAPTGAAADRLAARSQVADVGAQSHHPGEPRFVHVGEKLWNPAWVSPEYISDRDNLAPRIPDPSADPANYEASDFSWRVGDRPAGSDAEITYASSLFEDQPRYDAGKDTVGEFEADVPGRYTIELDAPDGTHEWTIHAFPEVDDSEGGPPRIELSGSVDGSVFEIETNAKTAPNSRTSIADLEAIVLADDRDALDTDAIEVDGLTATVPVNALDERARVHAVVHDGNQSSVVDTIELSPDGTIDLPNRPPAWMNDAVMYQIFTRSWAGRRGETTFQTLAEGDEIARGVDYLDELGIDVVWLTPIHPAVSADRAFPGGGPHGYDITDYLDVADDLVPEGEEGLTAYEAFVDACHDHGIRVCLDVVINHCGRTLPEFQDTIERQTDEPEYWPIVEAWDEDSQYFDWFDRLDVPFEYDSETLEVAPHATGFWNLQLHPNFNFDNVAVREYMLAFADFWAGEIGVDAFRCDIAWGVPHSFWKEFRAVVRDLDSEFMLLDEAIPNDRAFSENEFDAHFDTGGFTVPAHQIARGEADLDALFEAIRERQTEGFPDHALFLNAIENHDENRTLNEAMDGTRGDPHKAQRAVWAAGVALPGVPFVYYGQERAISEYGENRHQGDADPRTEGDVRPGGMQRAFMNWEEYDEAHLAFYQELIETYHELDVLKPEAALSGAWSNTMSDALVFGRDASGLDDIDGPDRVVVVINPDPGEAQVFLRPSVDGVDLVTGADISQETVSNATEVAVDTIAILETPDLLEIGTSVAAFDPETGTDDGPGGYVYPEDEAYAEGALDIDEFTIHETPDAYQFRLVVDGELTNRRDRPEGFSVQHLQVYLRDPEADGGTTEMREGANAVLAEPHQLRVVVDGDRSARLERHDGEGVTEGSVQVNEVTGAIVANVPKDAFERPLSAHSVAPVLFGYDPEAPGSVAQVTAEATETTFGGGEDGDANPNAIDLVTDINVDRADALAYNEDSPAEIGYIPLETPFESVTTIDVPTGEPYGPGTYEVPTGDDYYEAAWDIDAFAIEESRDDVAFEFTLAEPPENPWGFDPGFSHPFFQVYVHDFDADGPESITGRTGTNIETEVPYHYRVVVHGEGTTAVEDAEGNGVTRDVSVETDDETVRIVVPRAAIGWDREAGIALAPTVVPYDGFGDGGIRPIGSEADEHTIGGGREGVRDPAVMDMVTPDGIDRTDVLSEYDEDTRPAIPFVTIGELSREDLLAAVGDEETETDQDDEGEDDADGNEAEENEDAADTESDDGSAEEADGEDGIPGFGLGAGVAAIGGGALAAKRLRDRDRP